MAEEDLLWINEDIERGPIEDVKAKLSTAFEGLPADLCDDLQICRFLRGHNNDPIEAVEYMTKAVAFRRELVDQEPYKSLRASVAADTMVDVRKLPHSAALFNVLPLRAIDGLSACELPVAFAAPKLINFDAMSIILGSEDGSKQLDEFLRSYMEYRALVLHNLSHAQKRMVKFVDLRDLTQANVPSIISSGFPSKLKGMIGTLQDCYPETIHRLLIYSPPSAFATLLSIISSMLNSRMQMKLKVFPRGTPFSEICPLLDARAISSWTALVNAEVSFEKLVVANGTQEFTSKWLGKGETCKWTLALHDGSDVLLHHYFISAPGAEEGSELMKAEVKVIEAESPHEGSFVAEYDGVLWFCIDNYASWWNSKTVTLLLE